MEGDRLKVGDRVKFEGERNPYTVRAANNLFAVCTKPFNIKRTVLYTIIDLKKKIRGTENTVFCMGFESDKDCEEALERLTSGDSEISHRNRVPTTHQHIKK